MDSETKEYIDTLEEKVESEFRLVKKLVGRTLGGIDELEVTVIHLAEENRKDYTLKIDELRKDMNAGFEKMVDLINKKCS